MIGYKVLYKEKNKLYSNNYELFREYEEKTIKELKRRGLLLSYALNKTTRANKHLLDKGLGIAVFKYKADALNLMHYTDNQVIYKCKCKIIPFENRMFGRANINDLACVVDFSKDSYRKELYLEWPDGTILCEEVTLLELIKG